MVADLMKIGVQGRRGEKEKGESNEGSSLKTPRFSLLTSFFPIRNGLASIHLLRSFQLGHSSHFCSF
jgi:hypothetical protein